MCGIVGILGRTDNGVLPGMLDDIAHRGPDQEGQYRDGDLAMGARRLSIVDLAGGDQPVSNEDGSVHVVFNGEIYNHSALKQDLEDSGHRFRTECDTEVLVHLWEEYGPEMSSHLKGMFAFSIWDERQEELYLARDRLGIKPLFYAESGEELLWASNVRALLNAGVEPRVDRQALHQFLSLGYSLWPDSLVEDVRKLPPGNSLHVSDGEVVRNRYWSLQEKENQRSETEIVNGIRRNLENAVESRLMADVPLGTFLSGGVDSSTIVGIMDDIGVENIATFAISFPNSEYDEGEEARFVANHFGTNHHELTVEAAELDRLPEVIEYFGEPLADPAILPTYLLSEHAREHVKTVLTGEGADELFAGYPTYRRSVAHRRRVGWLPDAAFDAVGQAADRSPKGRRHLRYLASLKSSEEIVLGWANGFESDPGAYTSVPGSARERLLERIRESSDTADERDQVDRIANFDATHQLPDGLLYKVDHSTMAVSLEARVPFLDHEFVEFAQSIPGSYKTSGEYKRLLKRAVEDLLPQRVLDREKQGFNPPVSKWFREENPMVYRYFSEERLAELPYIETNSTLRLLEEHRTGRRDHKLTLWKTLNYAIWYWTHIAPER